MKNKMNKVIKLIGDLGERFYYPIMAVAVVVLFAAVATSVSGCCAASVGCCSVIRCAEIAKILC